MTLEEQIAELSNLAKENNAIALGQYLQEKVNEWIDIHGGVLSEDLVYGILYVLGMVLSEVYKDTNKAMNILSNIQNLL